MIANPKGEAGQDRLVEFFTSQKGIIVMPADLEWSVSSLLARIFYNVVAFDATISRSSLEHHVQGLTKPGDTYSALKSLRIHKKSNKGRQRYRS